MKHIIEHFLIVQLGKMRKAAHALDKVSSLLVKHPQQNSLDWLTIALACGYNHYQHLVKDYKEFAAVTPTIYYRQDCKAPERYFGRYES